MPPTSRASTGSWTNSKRICTEGPGPAERVLALGIAASLSGPGGRPPSARPGTWSEVEQRKGDHVAQVVAESDESGEQADACADEGKVAHAFIIWALLERPRRFTDLLDLIDGVSDRMLTKRLREMEDAGIVSRRRYREVPPRVEYALTEAGRALSPIIEAMEAWAASWAERKPAPPVRGEIPPN